jgi:hypothetical protein
MSPEVRHRRRNRKERIHGTTRGDSGAWRA